MSQRPLGHIAGNLNILAIGILDRLRRASAPVPYLCWVEDDGVVYMTQAKHLRSKAVQAHAPEQIVGVYALRADKPQHITTFDVHNDLVTARTTQAARILRQAHEAVSR